MIKLTKFQTTSGGGSVVVGNTSAVVSTFACLNTASVGDVVYFSPDDDNFVLVNDNNRVEYPSIGVIIEKISSTECSVLLHGISDVLTFAGIVKGKRIFLSMDGTPTSILPADGYIQILGVCKADGKVFINPQLERVKRTPF